MGQILAGTPISKMLYLAGKTLSNFVVLGVIMVVLAIAAIVLLLVRSEEGGFDLGALLGPFLFLGLPAMLFIAALAVFFESVPWLRHGFGNIVYFFAWTALVVVPMETGLQSADVLGLKMPMDRIQSDVRMAVADYNGTFSIGTAGGGESKEVPVRWAGLRWTSQRIGYRLFPVGYTFVLVLLAALCGGAGTGKVVAAPQSREPRGWRGHGEAPGADDPSAGGIGGAHRVRTDAAGRAAANVAETAVVVASRRARPLDWLLGSGARIRTGLPRPVPLGVAGVPLVGNGHA